MIDATATIAMVADIDDIAEVAERYAQASGNDPQSVPGFVYIQLVPERIQLWKGVAEFTGRTVMRAGVWLDDQPGHLWMALGWGHARQSATDRRAAGSVDLTFQ